MATKRIGILTGGGDVPGLSSMIKAVVCRAAELGCEVVSIRRGWEGLTHADLKDPASTAHYILPLNRENTRTIDRTGGAFLHTSRTSPKKMKNLPPVAGMAMDTLEETKSGLMTAVNEGRYAMVPIPDPKLGPCEVDIASMYNTECYCPQYKRKIGLPIFLTRP
jgi:6-phosphofructokinase 1